MIRGGLIQHGANGHTSEVPVFSSGSYSGNGTQNRVIPHNLGKTPKYVWVTGEHASAASVLYVNTGSNLNSSALARVPVTAWDTTNFYVGGPTTFAGNEVNYDYYWLAIG